MLVTPVPVAGLWPAGQKEALGFVSQCVSIAGRVGQLVEEADREAPGKGGAPRRRRSGPTKAELRRRGVWPRARHQADLELSN